VVFGAPYSDPRVDPRYLPAFLAVCEAGTVRAAAPLLHRTQPAVTYQIRRLEEQLGAPLFERVGRRLLLTPSGAALRDFARRTLGELGALAERIAERAPERQRPLRVASVSGFGRYVAFPALCRCLATPGLSGLGLDLVYRTADQVYARLQAGSSDLGLVYTAKSTSRLLIEPLYREELVLVAPRDGAGPGVAGDPARLESYSRTPFVGYEEGDHVFGLWFQAVFGRPPRSLRSLHQVEELEEALELVARGFGVSIVPRDCVRAARGRVRVVRPRARRCHNDVFAVTRPGPAAHPHLERVLARLRRECAPAAGGRRRARTH